MAFALVSNGTVASGTSTCSPAFGQATTSGNLLVCWVAATGSLGTVLSGSGSTWSTVPLVNSNSRAHIFYKANCGAGETAPGVTEGTGGAVFALLAEFSGGATSSPLDQHGDPLPSGTSPVSATGASVDQASGELEIGCSSGVNTKATTTTTSHTYTSGTASLNLNNDATSVATHYRFTYAITASNASADSFSYADASMSISVISAQIASFKLPGGAATPDYIPITGGGYYWMKGIKNKFWIPRPKLWLPKPIGSMV